MASMISPPATRRPLLTLERDAAMRLVAEQIGDWNDELLGSAAGGIDACETPRGRIHVALKRKRERVMLLPGAVGCVLY